MAQSGRPGAGQHHVRAPIPNLVRVGFHHTFGWLRRSELDNRDGYCYEAPDGDLIFSAMIWHERQMLLYELIDAETGEHYLVDTLGAY